MDPISSDTANAVKDDKVNTAPPAEQKTKGLAPTPTVGRIVLYGLRSESGVVKTRPAIVVGSSPGSVNVQVFTDGANDFADARATVWATSVPQGAEGEPGSWWWPPKV